mgnify:CR=1 FL=1
MLDSPLGEGAFLPPSLREVDVNIVNRQRE